MIICKAAIQHIILQGQRDCEEIALSETRHNVAHIAETMIYKKSSWLTSMHCCVCKVPYNPPKCTCKIKLCCKTAFESALYSHLQYTCSHCSERCTEDQVPQFIQCKSQETMQRPLLWRLEYKTTTRSHEESVSESTNVGGQMMNIR